MWRDACLLDVRSRENRGGHLGASGFGVRCHTRGTPEPTTSPHRHLRLSFGAFMIVKFHRADCNQQLPRFISASSAGPKLQAWPGAPGCFQPPGCPQMSLHHFQLSPARAPSHERDAPLPQQRASDEHTYFLQRPRRSQGLRRSSEPKHQASVYS